MMEATQQPVGNVHLYGGVFVKEMFSAKAGTVIPQHAHTYDHISYLAAGAVAIWKDGEFMGEFTAPCAVQIAARAKHRFETLADGTLVLCLHAMAEGEDVDIHEEHQLEMEG